MLRGFAARCAESLWLSGQVAYFSSEAPPLLSARRSLAMFLRRLMPVRQSLTAHRAAEPLAKTGLQAARQANYDERACRALMS
jgi:hypothetical protein